jgi:hypothetical protein
LPATDVVERAERLLGWFDQYKLRTLCFWDAQAELKLLCTKILLARDARLVDVSTGPAYFKQLEATRPLQRRLAFGTDAYLSRLDDLIALSRDAAPAGAAQPRRLSIIPMDVEAACEPFPVDRLVQQYVGLLVD